MPGLPPVEIPAQAVPLGHEADPFAFVGHLLQVFREVRRTLRPEGVLSVNLGDCYATGAGLAKSAGGRVQGERWTGLDSQINRLPVNGLRPKNLLLMPWRFALAMQADGWVLRSRMPGGVEMEPDVLWRKSSTMPESVRDRPTVDFEDVLIFAQRGSYYWDQEAGREESSGRNMRAAWTINPEPTDEEHFAAWPVELAARLIRVTTSERGCCPDCGAPWERVVERTPDARTPYKTIGEGPKKASLGAGARVAKVLRLDGRGGDLASAEVSTLGWSPTCAHDAEPIPCRVLDPFAGLGRTWEAARETGRRFAGVDLSLEYCRIARSRSVLEAAERRKAAEAKRARTITGPLFQG